MRRGFDRLALQAKAIVGEEVQKGGALVVFANRGATRLKVLWFEHNGCRVLYKRLHRAVFELPLAAIGVGAHRHRSPREASRGVASRAPRRLARRIASRRFSSNPY
jgi:hypothetical protein